MLFEFTCSMWKQDMPNFRKLCKYYINYLKISFYSERCLPFRLRLYYAKFRQS